MTNPALGHPAMIRKLLAQEKDVKKSNIEMLDEVEAALIDVLSGNRIWNDIRYITGLSDERCHEIECLFNEVRQRYNVRHNIK